MSLDLDHSACFIIPLFRLLKILILTYSINAGASSIGVLVWAVVPDSEASLYKTLVANTE